MNNELKLAAEKAILNDCFFGFDKVLLTVIGIVYQFQFNSQNYFAIHSNTGIIAIKPKYRTAMSEIEFFSDIDYDSKGRIAAYNSERKGIFEMFDAGEIDECN